MWAISTELHHTTLADQFMFCRIWFHVTNTSPFIYLPRWFYFISCKICQNISTPKLDQYVIYTYHFIQGKQQSNVDSFTQREREIESAKIKKERLGKSSIVLGHCSNTFLSVSRSQLKMQLTLTTNMVFLRRINR